jgi:hypothetical protein|tara:strand:+ start:3501 stop:4139 length:639 start_codon:yes stop_codon:yes gene_type:complete
MALNNFANLKSSIANWLGRSDLTNEITDFIALAEQDFNSKLANTGYNKMINLATLSVNDEIEALPSGFLGVASIYIDSNRKNALQYVSPETAFSMYGGSLVGQPEVYTIIGDNIHFYPMPDSTYSVKMYYYKKFDTLVNDTDTNDVLTNHSDVYLYGALYFSHTFIRGIDPTIIQEWLSFYNNGVERVVALNTKNKYNQDAPLIMRSTVNEE